MSSKELLTMNFMLLLFLMKVLMTGFDAGALISLEEEYFYTDTSPSDSSSGIFPIMSMSSSLYFFFPESSTSLLL